DEAIFEMLSKQLELARIDEAKEGSLIQVIDQATPPDNKSGPSRSLITLAGFVVALAMALGWVALRNAFSRARGNPHTDAPLNLLRSRLKFTWGKNGSTQY